MQFDEVKFVAAVVLVNDQKEVLITQRPQGRSGIAEGLWEFPGGKLEQNEAPALGARREIGEELGVDVDINTLTPLPFLCNHWQTPTQKVWQVVVLPFLCHTWQGEPKGLEGQGMKWVPAEQLESREVKEIFLPEGQEVLTSVKQAVLNT